MEPDQPPAPAAPDVEWVVKPPKRSKQQSMRGFLVELTPEQLAAQKVRDEAKHDAATRQIQACANKAAADKAAKPKVGRPRNSTRALVAQAPASPPAPSQAKKVRTNWWAAPKLVRVIMRTVTSCQGFLPAIRILKRDSSDLFSDLRDNTVCYWYHPQDCAGQPLVLIEASRRHLLLNSSMWS